MFLKDQVASEIGNVVIPSMNVMVKWKPVICLVMIIKQLIFVNFYELGTVLDFMFCFSVS